MAKFKVMIDHKAYFQTYVVVEAEDLEDAIKRVEDAWQKDDQLYEEVTDMLYDEQTDFFKCGVATPEDEKTLYRVK